MYIVVMKNDNFVASHPRTVVKYIIKCKTTTKIYNVHKLDTLIYVHKVFFVLCVLFYSYL